MLRLHGIDKGAADRYTKRYQHWDMPVLGWKYNMDNIQAALLIGQLEKIEKFWKRRNEIWFRYEDAFHHIEGIKLMITLAGCKHGRHLFTIQVPPEKRDPSLWSLQGKGVGVAVNYRAIHLLKYYREKFGFKKGDFPVAEKIGARTISLPLYPKLKDKEVDYVIETTKKVIARCP
jgi:UDP-4-amino-4-deoxy-L-arabinose-oxoglutarate aminotransferase